MAKKKKKDFEILETGYIHYRVATALVKPNPMNPRVIEDHRFQQLVDSVKENPHVLSIRPIVVNKDMITLGGNQRLKAAIAAGLKSVWILNADDIDDKEQRSFIIADNVDFGKWDNDLLRSCGYEPVELKRLGVEEVDVINAGAESLGVEEDGKALPSEDIVEPEVDESELQKKYETFQNNSIKQIVLYYPNDLYEKVCQTLDEISKQLDCDDNSEIVLRLINFWEFNNDKKLSDFDSFEGESREDQNDESS